MGQSLTTDLQLHRLLLAKLHHVCVESGGECFGFQNLEYICSDLSSCCRRILEVQIIIFKSYGRYAHLICRKCLVTLMNSFQRWGLSYALGDKSAEYVFGFISECDINLKYVTIRFMQRSYSDIPATLVIHFSLRGCQIIFFINCIFLFSFFTSAGYITSFSSKN